MKGKLLGSLEEKVMQYFWKRNTAATIAELHQHLNKNDRLAYTTVSTIVGRLVAKKLLVRVKSGRSFIYHSRLTQDAFLSSSSRRLIKNLLWSFGDVAIAGFVEELRDNPDAIKKLKELSSEG
jgi:predicted transcriptional regulator